MAGLYDTPTVGLFSGGWNGDPGMTGMLTPQDRLMSIFAGLSNAGARMADPHLSRGQALAAGFSGLGTGISESNQQALLQKLLGMKVSAAKQEADDKKMLGDMFANGGSAAAPTPISVAEPGQSVAQAMQNRINAGSATQAGSARADILSNPAVTGAMLRLYGPQGLAALRAEDDPSKRYMKLGDETVVDLKAAGGPKVSLTVAQPKTDLGKAIRERDSLPADDPRRALYDAQINKTLTESGFRFTADGMAPIKGGMADPGYKATVAGAEANAKVPAAIAEAAGKMPFDVAKDYLKPQHVGPGAVVLPGVQPPQDIMRLLNPSGIPANVPRIGQPAQPAPMPAPPAGMAPGGSAPMPQPPAGMVKPNAAPMPAVDPSKITSAPAGDPLADASPEDLKRIANDPTYPADPEMRAAAKAKLAAAGTPMAPQAQATKPAPAGPTPIAVNPNPPPGSPERAESAKYGTQLADRFNDIQTAARSAAQTVDNVRMVRAIPTETDRLAPAREVLGGYLQALGYKGDLAKDAGNLQAFNAVASNYVLGKQLEQKGVQTEGDARRMEKMFANASNTPEANDLILRAVNAQALRQMEQADFYESHRGTTGSLDGAEKAWREHIRSTPLVQTRADGKAVFFNEFADAAQRKYPDITPDQIMAEWRKGGK